MPQLTKTDYGREESNFAGGDPDGRSAARAIARACKLWTLARPNEPLPSQWIAVQTRDGLVGIPRRRRGLTLAAARARSLAVRRRFNF